MKALIRAVLERLVRLYYPVIAVEGDERVPWGEPCLFVLNHPNGLLDPMLLRLGLGHPVRFLGKSTLFANPIGRLTMEAFGGIPVYRQREAGAAAGDPSRNEETFARCREALELGDWIALFPEGTSHSDPEMKPFKTGAARIALSAERQNRNGLRVVPVGLYYEQKAAFRSRAVLTVGSPLLVADYLDRYKADERATVDAFTDEIRAGLDAVVLQADTRELVMGVARVAFWTVSDAAEREDLARVRRRASEMLAAWRALRASDPARAESLLEAGRQYLAAVEALGVRDPWALEVERVTWEAALRATGPLVLLAPFALAGVLLGWPAYRLTGIIAGRVAGAEDVLGTFKLLGGLLFVPIGWAIMAAWLGARFGWLAVLAVAVLGPLGGYAALRWEERWNAAMEALQMAWLRSRRPEAVAELVQRRRALAEEIERAMGTRE